MRPREGGPTTPLHTTSPPDFDPDRELGTMKDIGLTAEQIAATDGLAHADPDLLARGLRLIQTEKASGFRESLRHHWRAVAWSVVLSLALVMDGACPG